MRVAAEATAPELSHQGNHLRIPVHRLNRAEAQARQVRLSEDAAHEARECRLRQSECPILPRILRKRGRPGALIEWLIEGQIPAPAAQVDPRKHQLVASGGNESADLAENG